MAIFEPVSAEYSRCNLAAWKHLQLPAEWLLQMFFHSACNGKLCGGKEGKCGDALYGVYRDYYRLRGSGPAPFPSAAWRKYKEGYLAGGVRPVHHSEEYRSREKPAYRIVKREYEKLLPVLQKLATIQEQATKSKPLGQESSPSTAGRRRERPPLPPFYPGC